MTPDRVTRFLKELTEAQSGELPWNYVQENYSDIVELLEDGGYIDINKPGYDWPWTDLEDNTFVITDKGRTRLSELEVYINPDLDGAL